jgi:hypothetical protein
MGTGATLGFQFSCLLLFSILWAPWTVDHIYFVALFGRRTGAWKLFSPNQIPNFLQVFLHICTGLYSLGLFVSCGRRPLIRQTYRWVHLYFVTAVQNMVKLTLRQQFNTANTKAHHWPRSTISYISLIFTTCLSKIRLNIIFPSPPRSSKWTFSRRLRTKILY